MPLTKAQAKQLSILDVARSLGMDLKRSSHNEYYWTVHDSLKLNTTKNTWTWYSRTLYGDTIGLVQEIKQVSYKDAITFLSGGSFQTVTPHQEKREPFTYYLERYEHPDFEIGRQYLKNERGLSDDTIDTFLASGNLAAATYKKGDYFEPVIVFKSRDPEGNLLGATLQGIVENRARYLERGRLKKILPNSDGSVGFSLTLGQPKRLVFAESPIDLMSYYELHQETLQDVRLVAMDGLKRSVISRHLAQLQAERTGRPLYGKDKIRQSLTEAKKQGFFDKGKNDQLITIAVDNDPSGRDFVEKLQKDGIPVVADLPPKSKTQSKMDWNDYLKQIKKENNPMENHSIKTPNKGQIALFDNLADLPPKKDKKEKQTPAELTSYGSFRIDDEFLERRYGTKPEEDTITTALEALKSNLSLEGIGVDNDPTECAFVSAVDVDEYQLDLAVYSHTTELEPHGHYDWSLLVLEKTEPLGFLAYGEDWFNDQTILKEKLTELQAWINQGTAKEHLLTQQDYTHFLDALEKKTQEEEETKKTPDNLQESTISISEQQKNERTSQYKGSLQPEAEGSASPVSVTDTFDRSVTSRPTRSSHYLNFTIKEGFKSRRTRLDQSVDKEKLAKLNRFSDTIQEAAQYYQKELADSKISYFTADGNIVQVNFLEKNFMHLTGLKFIGENQTPEKTLSDLAVGGDVSFDDIRISNTDSAFAKIKVLPELKAVLQTDSFYFDQLQNITRYTDRFDSLIKSNDKDIMVLFKATDENGIVPTSIFKSRETLEKELEAANKNEIIGIYRERDGQLEQIAINEDYVKDGGKAFFNVLSRHELEPLIEEQAGVAITQEEVNRDFDGDGIPDEEERKQGTDPYDARSNTYNNDAVDERSILPETEATLGELSQGNETADKVAPTKSDRTIAEMIKAKDTVAVNRYLKDGVKNYLDSEKYKAFLTQMSKLNQYSPRNLRLLLAQKPDATYLASYNKWKKDFGRQVKKGEKALSIILPVTYLKKDKEGNVLLDKNGNPETVTTFRLQARVFDVSQTEGKDLPQMATNLKEQLTDEQYANLYRAAMTIAKNNHLTVRFDKLPKETNGYFNPNQQEIVLQQDNMSKDQIVKTFLHELAHAELHQAGQQAEIAKNLKELQAESTAFVVASYYGLDTDNYTFPYLASWSDDKKTLADLEAQLEVVHQEAQSLIRRMDDTLAEIQLRQERQKGHQFSNKLEQFKEKTAKDIASHKEQEKQKEADASKKAKGVSK